MTTRTVSQDAGALLLRDLVLVDVRTGRLVPDAALLIQAGRVARVARREDFGVGDGLHAVGLGGRYVMPGLIDPHVHLAFSGAPDAIDRVGPAEDPQTWHAVEANAAAALTAGVTTVADCGAPGDLGRRAREAAATGGLRGPRVLSSLRPITTPGGHCHSFGEIASGVNEARAAARRLLDEGADFLKVMASGGGTTGATPATERQFGEDALRAIVDESHRAGRRVVAHARAPSAIAASMAAGVDRIEHLTWEVPGGVAFDLEVARRMAGQGTWADPTLPAGYRAARSGAISAARRGELLRQFSMRYPNYRRLAESGVRLLAGSDAGTPLTSFGEPALALGLLVEVAGYDAPTALRAATLWAAEALGLDDRGALEPGMRADLVVLGRDPLEDLSAHRFVEGVMLGGVWVSGAGRAFAGDAPGAAAPVLLRSNAEARGGASGH